MERKTVRIKGTPPAGIDGLRNLGNGLWEATPQALRALSIRGVPWEYAEEEVVKVLSHHIPRLGHGRSPYLENEGDEDYALRLASGYSANTLRSERVWRVIEGVSGAKLERLPVQLAALMADALSLEGVEREAFVRMAYERLKEEGYHRALALLEKAGVLKVRATPVTFGAPTPQMNRRQGEG